MPAFFIACPARSQSTLLSQLSTGHARTMASHREMASEAGVNAYLTKPYADAGLLSTLAQFAPQDVVHAAAYFAV